MKTFVSVMRQIGGFLTVLSGGKNHKSMNLSAFLHQGDIFIQSFKQIKIIHHI